MTEQIRETGRKVIEENAEALEALAPHDGPADIVLEDGTLIDHKTEADDAPRGALSISLHDADFVKALDAELGQDIEERTPPNRATRRANLKRLRALVRKPDGMKRLHHPLTRELTPYGIKELARRRAAEGRAKRARQKNRGGGKRIDTWRPQPRKPETTPTTEDAS